MTAVNQPNREAALIQANNRAAHLLLWPPQGDVGNAAALGVLRTVTIESLQLFQDEMMNHGGDAEPVLPVTIISPPARPVPLVPETLFDDSQALCLEFFSFPFVLPEDTGETTALDVLSQDQRASRLCRLCATSLFNAGVGYHIAASQSNKANPEVSSSRRYQLLQRAKIFYSNSLAILLTGTGSLENMYNEGYLELDLALCHNQAAIADQARTTTDTSKYFAVWRRRLASLFQNLVGGVSTSYHFSSPYVPSYFERVTILSALLNDSCTDATANAA
jgi:hypothetical protein